MIRHTVLFRFRPDVPPETVTAVLAELETFPTRYPAMRNWVSGPNVSSRDDSMSHGFAVDFDTEQDLLDYLGSPSHEEFVRTRWRPVILRQAIASLHR
ncbi:Dabb family protein [Micromonospora sp. NPDC049900]|uniref:Dabb family protein n=1 Tax=unclassified Micromonospora TaxID=2617518 RepID=UPI0037934E3D